MENTLVDLMSNFIALTDEEKKGILEAFPIKHFAKETHLLKEGQIATESYLVIKGCVREYTIQDGEEVISAFYTELQPAVNFESLANKKPSKLYFTCNEDATVAILNTEKENALYQKFPRFGEVCRVEMEKMLGASQNSLVAFKNASPKERYMDVLSNRPDLIQRVPQYQLASYLGIKPETLSRIRKRINL